MDSSRTAADERKKLENVEKLMNEVIKSNRSFKFLSLAGNLSLPTGIKEIKALFKELKDPSLTAKQISDIKEKILDVVQQRLTKEDSKRDPLFNEFYHGVFDSLQNKKPLPTMTELDRNKRDLNALNQFLKKVPETEGVSKIKSLLNNNTISYQDKIEAIKEMKFPKENDSKEGNKFCRDLINCLKVEVTPQLKGGSLGKALNNSYSYKSLNAEKNKLEAKGLKDVLKEIEPSERPSFKRK